MNFTELNLYEQALLLMAALWYLSHFSAPARVKGVKCSF